MSDLTKQDWFKASATQKVMSALEGERQAARFVGGCVRDALLGRPVHDIDIATLHKPEKTIALLEQADIRAIPTGIDHGTVTAICKGNSFEITTLRKDITTDGRHAVVSYTDDWVEDAARRDFTFNALSVGLDGIVHDPFNGLADLKAGHVRFVGEPEARIQEDYLRLLRFFRFSAYYGRGPVDADAIEACRHLANGLETLSGERILQEMLRLLAAPRPVKWLQLMQKNGVLKYLLPTGGDLYHLEMLCSFEEAPDPLRRLAILLPQDRAVIDALVKRWHLSNEQRDRLVHARLPHGRFHAHIGEDALRALLYRNGAVSVFDQVLIYWATKGFTGVGPKEQNILNMIEAWRASPVEFPLKGRDLLEQGFRAGPHLGLTLKDVEDWWCDRGCYPDHETCLKEAVRFGQSGE